MLLSNEKSDQTLSFLSNKISSSYLKIKRMFPVELELSGIPQWEECLLRVKLHFRQQLATIGNRICFLESLTCHLINPSLSCMHAYTHSHIHKQRLETILHK